MKMIMPIARPATVSVSQVENEPISGSAISASTGTSNSGSDVALPQPGRCNGAARSSLVLGQRQAEQGMLQALVAGEVGHGAGMDDAAIVHHRHSVAKRAREIEVLLHQQDSGVGSF